ncbi:MAG: AMP-binding protein [Bdellovibrionia bacterium]
MDLRAALLRQLDSRSERLAVSLGASNVSYGELALRVSDFASIFVKETSPVALLAEKGPETYGAVLALFFTGRAAALISTTQPAARALSQIRACGAATLAFGPRAKAFADEVVGLGGVEPLELAAARGTYVDLGSFNVASEAIQYIAFTSGTTTEPKAVPISYGNFSALMSRLEKIFMFKGSDRFSQTYPLNFDPALADIFSCLSVGGCLFPLEEKNRYDIFEFIQSNELTVWSSVPTLAELNFARAKEPLIPSLKTTIFTGESLSRETAVKWGRAAENSEIYNFYGPVETTVWATYSKWSGTIEGERVPIGKPLRGLAARVCGEDGKPVRKGQTGELIVSGDQVFSGYLNGEKTGQEYRTGDLVFEDEKGDLHWTGRRDFQFKIAGQRFEPFEIEEILKEKLKFAFCFLVPVDGPSGRPEQTVLFADRPTELEDVRSALHNGVPAAVIPTRIFVLRDPPNTASGKVDRRKLQESAAGLIKH